MKNGLLDMGLVSFVFTPLVLTVTLLLSIWWVRTRGSRSALDRPGLLLAAAVRRMPEERRDWGAAMMAELGRLQGSSSRWWFALGCARAALFPPRAGGPPRYLTHALTRLDPICGMLSVAVPPLGLPFLYLATVVFEAIGGSPLTPSSRWSDPAAAMEVARFIGLLSLLFTLSGLPLGVVGLMRRERLRWLSVLGMLSSLCIIGFFLIVMSFVAGGPNGD